MPFRGILKTCKAGPVDGLALPYEFYLRWYKMVKVILLTIWITLNVFGTLSNVGRDEEINCNGVWGLGRLINIGIWITFVVV